MSDMTDLYQEMILDHYKNPRNFGKPDGCVTHCAEGHNPLCGDQLEVYLHVDGDTITEVTFEGSGCAISKASASLMTAHLKGKTIDQAEALFSRVHQMLKGEEGVELEDLGKLAALSGVCAYPVRVKCATLAWHTLHQALAEKSGPTSTE